ncbi:hypothetical protein N9Y28_02645, partial [Euryarchaeota archaeon]|nr:hypothetical protein [Euryarchaeota archaeon]
FPTNRNGSVYLNWEDGMPLNEFITLVCSTAGSDMDALHNLEVRAMKANVFQSNLPTTSLEEIKSAQSIPQKPFDVLAELQRRRS